MSLQDGSVKFTGGFRRGKILLAFLGVVELALTTIFVITLASNILFPEQSSAAANAVSKIISYEGRLTDASGNPLGGSGTNYCFRFSIYDNQTVGAGTKLWPAGTPTTNTVYVANGVFNVGIGAADDLGSFNFYDNDTIFLNIEATSSLAASCAGETSFVTLAPRQRFDAVAFARATRDVYGSLLKTVNASNLVQVGSGSGAATPILLGLDWKNVADTTLSYVGQSCTTNGTMWYNSSVSRALICEGGLVQELGNAATTTIAAIGTNATAPISAGTVVFSNSNGVTFGQNGSTITASVNAGGGGLTNINLSAGTTSNNLSNFVFSNSNGVSFGLNGSTVTASVAAGGGGGGATMSYYFPMNGIELQAGQQGQGTLHMRQVAFPNLHMDRIVFPIINTNSSNSSGSHTISVWFGIYTKNVSTLSLLQSASTSLAVTHSGTAGSYSLYSGIRNVSVGLTTTLTDGNYWVGMLSRTTSGGANGSYSQLIGSMIASNNLGWWSSSHNTTYQGMLGVGVYSATTSAMPNSIGFSQIRGSDSLAYRYPAYWFVSNTI